MSIPSKYTYSRSITKDVAAVLAQARSRCWCEPQLVMLDAIVDEFNNLFDDLEMGHDADRFARSANAHVGRMPDLPGKRE